MKKLTLHTETLRVITSDTEQVAGARINIRSKAGLCFSIEGYSCNQACISRAGTCTIYC